MKKLLKTILILSPIVVLALLGALYLNLNRVIHQGVETMGPRILQAPVNLERVAVSIIDGKGEIEGLVVGNPEGFRTPSAFELTRLDVEVDIRSLRGDEVVVRKVVVDSPVITVEGLDAKNLRALQENAAAFGGPKEEGEAPEEEDEGGKKVVIDHLIISGARVNYSPAILRGQSIPIPLPTIEMKDIGRDSGGLTIGELLSLILSNIDDAVVGVLRGSGELIGNATSQILGGAAAAAELGVGVVGGAAGEGARIVGEGAGALRNGARRVLPFGGRGEEDAEEAETEVEESVTESE